MKGSECLKFVGRPDQIGSLSRALCFDGTNINHDYDYSRGVETLRTDDPVRNWNEIRLAEVLQRPGGDNLVIINLETVGFGDVVYTQPRGIIDRKINELAAWVGTIRRLNVRGARLALDYPLPTWEIGDTWTYQPKTTSLWWANVRYINERLREMVFPLLDMVCVQTYWTIRWGDSHDLYGEGPIWGNFWAWKIHACALSALTNLPAVALFSPSIIDANNPSRFPPRALSDEEMDQSMRYLSASGFSELCWWGTVEQQKVPSGWNRWDDKAPWVGRILKYFDKQGNFMAPITWNFRD